MTHIGDMQIDRANNRTSMKGTIDLERTRPGLDNLEAMVSALGANPRAEPETRPLLRAFGNGDASITIGGLTIEDQGDRLSIYGELENADGSDDIIHLTTILQSAAKTMRSGPLPNQLPKPLITEGPNPFD